MQYNTKKKKMKTKTNEDIKKALHTEKLKLQNIKRWFWHAKRMSVENT